eukprot:79545-Chlamydomonas_euryale.AAC.1
MDGAHMTPSCHASTGQECACVGGWGTSAGVDGLGWECAWRGTSAGVDGLGSDKDKMKPRTRWLGHEACCMRYRA